MHIEQIITEPMYIWDICGKKKPSSQMLGKCSKCGVYVCNTCGRIKGDRVYCKEHGGCFVATVVFSGEPNLMAEIYWLRKFRDAYLLKSMLGSLFVRIYYIIGPFIADFISHSEHTKQIVRFLLKTLIKFLKKATEKDKRSLETKFSFKGR